MKLLKYKRSQTHVEMILSFVIFIGFVLSLFFFLNPLKESKVSYNSMNNVEDILLNNISIRYSSIAVILNNPSTVDFSIPNNLNISGRVLVIDQKGNFINSENDYPNLKINIEPKSGSDARLYRLYFSDIFNSYPASSPNFISLPSNSYTFGVLTLEKSVIWENLQDLNKSYIEDYSKLKNDLRIRENFEFVVYDINKTTIFFDTSHVHKTKSSFVLSREIPLRIINKNATQGDIVLNLRVW